MSMNMRATEAVAVVGWIAPITTHATTYVLSTAISLAANVGRKFVAYTQVGAIGSSATVDGQWYWCATQSGSYVAITGSNQPQDTVGTDVTPNEITTEQVEAFAPTALFIKFGCKTAVADTATGVLILGFEQANLPATVPTLASFVNPAYTGPISGIN